MKKLFGIAILAIMPAIMFAEVVFMPRLGIDIHKGIKNQMLDSALRQLINTTIERGKKPGENPKLVEDNQIPHSKPLVTMFTVGLDMQFIVHSNGFTFFWNNEFSYAKDFKAYEQFQFLRHPALAGGSDLKTEEGVYNGGQKLMLLSTEFLFGATFRRENAFNIHFGLGFKTSLSPATLGLLKPAFSGEISKIPNEMTVMILPALGGTFGFTYYFTEVVGISASINEFVGVGAFLSTKILGKDNEGIPNKAVGYASMGLSNNFAMKLGLNLRVHGVRSEGL